MPDVIRSICLLPRRLAELQAHQHGILFRVSVVARADVPPLQIQASGKKPSAAWFDARTSRSTSRTPAARSSPANAANRRPRHPSPLVSPPKPRSTPIPPRAAPGRQRQSPPTPPVSGSSATSAIALRRDAESSTASIGPRAASAAHDPAPAAISTSRSRSASAIGRMRKLGSAAHACRAFAVLGSPKISASERRR